ncbi:helix-turn-helix domain-containing protein [Streptomyces sp. N2-109]|uniref:Helix-turn-helix domain-containing protein n=1 Tax=Streptomyces gossypii TaxID=2883101 RepID=A0ABT2JTH3_9ACTN|nr:helix-turn-helix transcriptional regulator [Streptomyces gossypii]MCT2591172.1 helix-turn-helix domain-containing protein [Streptomyces gossypii]
MHHSSDPPPPWLLQQRLDIGRRIAAARMEANLTQEGLAERIGSSRSTVVRIELGITSTPLDRLLHIARALGVPPAQLLPDDQAPE